MNNTENEMMDNYRAWKKAHYNLTKEEEWTEESGEYVAFEDQPDNIDWEYYKKIDRPMPKIPELAHLEDSPDYAENDTEYTTKKDGVVDEKKEDFR